MGPAVGHVGWTACPEWGLGMSALTCRGCQREMRSPWESRADAPGTVREQGGGRCATCIRHKRGGTTRHRMEIGDPCETCQHPMRPSTHTIAQHPGTRRHWARGQCQGCYFAARVQRNREAARDTPAEPGFWDQPLEPLTDHPDPVVARNATGLNMWLTDRRRRRVPAGGIKETGETR